MAKKAKASGASKKETPPKTKPVMPAWEKPTSQLMELFYNALPEDNKVERKKMFGYPSAFVNGNMATGMYQQNIIARLDEKDRNDWITKKGAKQFEPMPGRPMKEYIVIPENIVNDAALLKKVLQQSITYVLTLKPKEKKK